MLWRIVVLNGGGDAVKDPVAVCDSLHTRCIVGGREGADGDTNPMYVHDFGSLLLTEANSQRCGGGVATAADTRCLGVTYL